MLTGTILPGRDAIGITMSQLTSVSPQRGNNVRSGQPKRDVFPGGEWRSGPSTLAHLHPLGPFLFSESEARQTVCFSIKNHPRGSEKQPGLHLQSTVWPVSFVNALVP